MSTATAVSPAPSIPAPHVMLGQHREAAQAVPTALGLTGESRPWQANRLLESAVGVRTKIAVTTAGQSGIMSNMENSTSAEVRHLFVAWRDVADSRIHPVARLTCHPNGAGFEFRYLNNIKALERFHALPGFPDLESVYRSATLFPLFDARIMSRRRPDYSDYIASLGLTGEEQDPFILLARSEGWKSTDRLEVFAAPSRVPDTDIGCSFFFLRGLRYHPGAEEVVDSLKHGERLEIRHEPDNEVNPLAIQILHRGVVLGHVPDYLVDHLHEVLDECGADAIGVSAEHVNPDSSGSHMRLLCRLESCWPDRYEPFSDARFLPLVMN